MKKIICCPGCGVELQLFSCVVETDPSGEKSPGIITNHFVCTNCAPDKRLNAIVREGGDAGRALILTEEEAITLQKIIDKED